MWNTYTKRSAKHPVLRYHVHRVFTIWPLSSYTFDLHQKKTVYLSSMWYTYIPNMKHISPNFPVWDIVFTRSLLFDPVDLEWPLTSTNNNQILVLNVIHLHIKHKISPSSSLEITCLHTDITNTHTTVWIQRIRLSSKPTMIINNDYQHNQQMCISKSQVYCQFSHFYLPRYCTHTHKRARS